MQFGEQARVILEPDFYEHAADIEGSILPQGLPLLRWQSKSTDGSVSGMLLYGEFGDPAEPVAMSNGLDPDETLEGAIASFLLWVRESVVWSPTEAGETFEGAAERHFAIHAEIIETLRQMAPAELLVDGGLVAADRYRSNAAGLDVWNLRSAARVLIAVDGRRVPPPLETWNP